jgi:hypothetical protein
VEIGRSLVRLGEKERALEELEHAVTLDVEDINAHLQKVNTVHPQNEFPCRLASRAMV